jgi:hypothetical protein
MSDDIILYDDPRAAVFEKREKELWWDINGRGYLTEEQARMHSRTHCYCEKHDNYYPINSYCKKCMDERGDQRYLHLPEEEWDGETPVMQWRGDKVFFSDEELIEYCDDWEIHPEDLQLVLCAPAGHRELTTEYWEESLDEEGEGFSKTFLDKIDELNELLSKEQPCLWEQTGKRVNWTDGRS